jgi:3-oxoadipate enol-lactonase
MAERIEVDGVELALERGGEGAPLVFVHGLGGAGSWAEQASAARQAGFEAVELDSRGAGGSAQAPGPYSVELWAADVVAVVERLGLERPALIGHSVGCMVAEHAAVELGERCRALALLGGRASWPEGAEEGFKQRAQLAEQGRMEELAEMVAQGALTEAGRENPDLSAAFRRLFLRNDPRGYAESARATARGRMRDPERVACPLLALAGSDDPVTPPEDSERIAGSVPDGSAAIVPGGAHWCQLELPGEVSGRLLGFVGGL